MMYFRYIFHLVFFELFLSNFVVFFVYPIAYIFRDWASKRNWFLQTWLWYFLHERMYGDIYINPTGKKTFWMAYRWAIRNSLDGYIETHKIRGKNTDYKGWETCQRSNAKYNWRTPKTKDIYGEFQDKNGEFMDLKRGIYGKQRITFTRGGKRYFRCSGAVPRRIYKNVYWIFAYKFGLDNYFWHVQFQPFTFKRLMEIDKLEFKTYNYG